MEPVGRRTFIKGLLAGSGLLRGGHSAQAQEQTSRVASVTDGAAWVGDGWTDADLDPDRVRAMLARALVEAGAAPDYLVVFDRTSGELGLGRADPAAIDHRAVVLSPVVEKPKPWERPGSDGCTTAGRGSASLMATAAVAAITLKRRRSGGR